MTLTIFFKGNARILIQIFRVDVKSLCVRLGKHILINNDDDDQTIILEVNKTFIPELYHKKIKYHDIALLKLQRNVEFNKSASPACLAEPYDERIEEKYV